jgi:hypothetical protein
MQLKNAVTLANEIDPGLEKWFVRIPLLNFPLSV